MNFSSMNQGSTMHKPLLFTLLFLLASAAALRAQACNFDNLMREGKVFLDKKKPEYRRALYKFNAARTCDPNQSAIVDKEVDRLFGMIEGERDKAVQLEKKARDAEVATRIALDSAEVSRERALAAKENAEAAEKKTAAVLDKIYFYQGRFGLAYDEGRYGFIDKNLITKIDFRYNEALPFDWTGFAKVKKDGDYFFIDTLGNEFSLATELNQLSSKITALDLSEKRLTEIPDNVLKSIPLKVLLLSFNQLQTLPAKIGELKSLQSLDLSANQLQTLPAQIGELKNLKWLDLSSNQLTSFPAQIGELKSLQSLYLSGNQLQTLPAQIGELKNLKSLNLLSNQLQTLPAQIGELKSLESLDLSSNEFRILPAQIGELNRLQSLDLSENQLRTLPEQIWELKNLKSLNLLSNQLQTLPAQIGELKNLKSLNLLSNQLQTLPAQIGELKSLQWLDLSYNQLQTLPAQIGELKSLQSLDLSYNQLQALPAQTGELKSLQSLDFSENQLQILSEQIWELKNLQSLDLSENQLQTLPKQIGELKSLQSLDLSENQLQTLPKQIGELKNLKWLNLGSNQLTSLPAQIGGLKSLQSLHLSGNQLHTLPIKIFAQMPNLKTITLATWGGTNPLSESTVSDLRAAMPWCEIEWEPEEFFEMKPFSPEAIFEKNEEDRKQWEAAVIEGEVRLKNNPTDTLLQKDLAYTYNALGWYQLLTGQFAEAEASINRGFELDATNIFHPLIRASSLLFQGKTEAAKQEYEKWKDLPSGENDWPFYRDAFLYGLEEIEKAGVIPEARKADVEEVRQLLGVRK